MPNPAQWGMQIVHGRYMKNKGKIMPAFAGASAGNVKIKGDERMHWVEKLGSACREDFGKEYLDYIPSVKTVDSLFYIAM